jgi:hypothetical protein
MVWRELSSFLARTPAKMSANATVKSALFQSIYQLLNAENLKSTAKALAKETTIDKKAVTSDDLLVIYNQYLEQKKQQVSKEESSESESDSSSDSESSEDEKPIAKPPVAVVKNGKKDESSDSDSDSSDSEDEKPQPKKVAAAPKKEESSDSESDSDSEEEVKKPAVPVKKVASESSSDSSDSSDSEEEPPKVAGNKVLNSSFVAIFLIIVFREKQTFLTILPPLQNLSLRVKMKNPSLKLPPRLSHLQRNKRLRVPAIMLPLFVVSLGLHLKRTSNHFLEARILQVLSSL